MKASTRSLGILRWLNWSPVVAFVGGIVAVVLGARLPFYPGVLGLAAAAGVAGFFMDRWKLRSRRARLFFDPAILSIVVCSVGMNLVPDGVSYTARALVGAQFIAVWMVIYAGLFATFRDRWIRDLEVYAS